MGGVKQRVRHSGRGELRKKIKGLRQDISKLERTESGYTRGSEIVENLTRKCNINVKDLGVLLEELYMHKLQSSSGTR